MVKITYTGNRIYRSLRTRNGNLVRWNQGETIDVEDEGLIEKLKGSKNFVEQNEVGKKTGGGGLKTGVRRPKRLGRPPKSKGKKVKPPKSVMDKVEKAINKKTPKSLKKPKGLKKKKGIGIDLDGDGKVDVVVGDD